MPILALIGMELPLLLGGSVVIEVLFNIPGMGRLMMQSILLQDWIVVFSILFLTGVLTVLGKLVTDIMIGSADKKNKMGLITGTIIKLKRLSFIRKICLAIIALNMVLALGANIIANDKPLYCNCDGHSLWPAWEDYLSWFTQIINST